MKIRKIENIYEDYYSVTFEFKSDFNQLIIMTQNVYLNDDFNERDLIEEIEIPTYYCK